MVPDDCLLCLFQVNRDVVGSWEVSTKILRVYFKVICPGIQINADIPIGIFIGTTCSGTRDRWYRSAKCPFRGICSCITPKVCVWSGAAARKPQRLRTGGNYDCNKKRRKKEIFLHTIIGLNHSSFSVRRPVDRGPKEIFPRWKKLIGLQNRPKNGS